MAEQSLEQLEQEFHQIVSGIHPADVVTKGNAQKKWNSIAKPLHSLGKLEDHIMQIAALTGDTDVNLNRKALIVMCADNGIVEEGISQSGQEVTYQVAESMGKRKSSVCLMAAQANAKVIPIDVGIAAEAVTSELSVAAAVLFVVLLSAALLLFDVLFPHPANVPMHNAAASNIAIFFFIMKCSPLSPASIPMQACTLLLLLFQELSSQ